MKTLIVLVLAAGLGAFAAQASSLSSVHKVYLMPMGGGFDQYLAERLTAEGVFTVVVDPKQADAVWSEHVGSGFTEAFEQMYPHPKPAKDSKEKKESEEEKKDQTTKRSLGRGRGNVFLVGVASRQVVWSTYLKMEDRSPRGLHQAAREIVKQLKKDLKGE